MYPLTTLGTADHSAVCRRRGHYPVPWALWDQRRHSPWGLWLRQADPAQQTETTRRPARSPRATRSSSLASSVTICPEPDQDTKLADSAGELIVRQRKKMEAKAPARPPISQLGALKSWFGLCPTGCGRR